MGWIMPVPVEGKPKPLGHRWVIGPKRFFGSHSGAPWLGLKRTRSQIKAL